MKAAILVFALAALLPAYAAGEPGTASVEINGNDYTIKYDATGLTVEGVTADTDVSSLIWDIDVDASVDSATLVITLERDVFDSVSDGLDDDFTVINDDQNEIDTVTDTPGETSRMLEITLAPGTEFIEIISFNPSGAIAQDAEEADSEERETDDVVEPVEEEQVEDTEEEEMPPAPPEPPAEQVEEEVEESEEERVEPQVEEEEMPPEPPAEQDASQCGPGTVLVNGECVLDMTCGPGTILVDGVCVVDGNKSGGGMFGKEFVVAAIAAIIGALAIAAIFGIISRLSKSKD